jgi:hypothetical protein
MTTSIQLIATCFGVGLAIAKYDFERRTRNSLLCGTLGAVGAAVENSLLGDALRAAVFIPVCFLLGAGGTYLAYTWEHRRRSRS